MGIQVFIPPKPLGILRNIMITLGLLCVLLALALLITSAWSFAVFENYFGMLGKGKIQINLLFALFTALTLLVVSGFGAHYVAQESKQPPLSLERENAIKFMALLNYVRLVAAGVVIIFACVGFVNIGKIKSEFAKKTQGIVKAHGGPTKTGTTVHLRKSLNWLQKEEECCGLKGLDDWLESLRTNMDANKTSNVSPNSTSGGTLNYAPVYKKYGIPPSCCAPYRDSPFCPTNRYINTCINADGSFNRTSAMMCTSFHQLGCNTKVAHLLGRYMVPAMAMMLFLGLLSVVLGVGMLLFAKASETNFQADLNKGISTIAEVTQEKPKMTIKQVKGLKKLHGIKRPKQELFSSYE